MTTDLTTLAAQIEERLTEDKTTAKAAADDSCGRHGPACRPQ